MSGPTIPMEATVLGVVPLNGCHAPDSLYAEQFWLPIIGPTALWAARRLAYLAIDGPFRLDVGALAPDLGVAPSALRKALGRLVMYRLAHLADEQTLALSVRWPPVDSRWRPTHKQQPKEGAMA